MIYLKKISIVLLIVCLVIAGIWAFTSRSNGKSSDELQAKVETEIDYLNSEIIDVMNKLNNISFANYTVETQEVSPNDESSSGGGSSQGGGGSSGSSGSGGEGESQGGGGNGQQSQSEGESGSSQGGQSGQGSGNTSGNSKKINVTEMVKEPVISADFDNVQWEELGAGVETFANSWNTIILDLYKMNIHSTDITDFSTNLDNLIIGIKNQDKTASLNSAANLYSYIPRYIEAFAQQSTEGNIANAKLHILNAYVAASNDNWEGVTAEMALAEQFYTTIMSDNELVDTKEYNVNKSYVSLKELQNSVKSQDKTIFFLKYKNLMQELEILG